MGIRFNMNCIFDRRLRAFAIGLLIGTIIINCTSPESIFYIAIANEYKETLNGNITVNLQKYIYYLFAQKLRFLVVYMTVFTLTGKIIVETAVLFIFGILTGGVISAFTEIYGTSAFSHVFTATEDILFYLFSIIIIGNTTRNFRKRRENMSSVKSVLKTICIYIFKVIIPIMIFMAISIIFEIVLLKN